VNALFPGAALVTVDDTDDRERASDGRSRFGAYLRQRAHRLHTEGEPLNAYDFAAVVWRIACPPVMAPGYVRLRGDVHEVVPVWGENRDGDQRLAFEVRVPLAHQAPAGWDGWHRTRRERDSEQVWQDPGTERPALLTTATLRLPTDDTWDLPTPWHTDPARLLDDAKQAVAAITRAINEYAGPVVTDRRLAERWGR
jgi:hypothetical protein